MNREKLAQLLNKAIEDNDGKSLAKLKDYMDELNLRSGCFLEENFNLIVSCMQQKKFLESKKSSNLLYIFYDWESLSESQKDRLLPELENAYGKLKDWRSWFMISEFLGEYYQNIKAFEALCRLKMLKASGPRSLVPHGFEHIVTDAVDKNLAKKAFNELMQMKNDPSEDVRNEVLTSLQRIENSKTKI